MYDLYVLVAKLIITLSSTALALSAGFVDLDGKEYKLILVFGWLYLFLSILSVFFGKNILPRIF